jgi:PilZ domain
MSLPDVEEKRQTERYHLGRLAAMFLGDDAVPHYCLVSDFSETGVRITSNRSKIPDQFVLVFVSSLPHRNGTYKVVWRRGNIVGAEFVSAGAPSF